MLKQLHVSNYALIDQLDISLSNGLTVITGETGAGKSILLGALGLILGKRADVSVLQDKSKKCVVEGVFKISDYQLGSFFEENDLDYELETVIRREISATGKSRAFINDTPVNLNQLRELTVSLVDIHSQHETLLLNNSIFKFSIIDSYALIRDEVEQYRSDYYKYKLNRQKLDDLIEQQKQSQLDKDYFQFQYDELADAKLISDEQEKLEQELKLISNSEQIKSKLLSATEAINNGDENLLDKLRTVVAEIRQISDFEARLNDISSRLDSVYIELGDIASEIDSVQESVEHNEEQLQIITERLDLIYALQQKHHVSSIDELLEVQKSLENKLTGANSLEDQIVDLGKICENLLSKLRKEADSLSKLRRQVSVSLEKEVKEILASLKMSSAEFKVSVSEFEELGVFGKDKVELLFSANKGGHLQELSKVASGGELSRLMLCLKAIISSKTALPTILFDEIDTGVSGEVADKVGRILKGMGEKMQVISITHLPQIAGKGNEHLYVFKEEKSGLTYSQMKKLDDEERVEELAKMLSGEKTTTAAMENAKELLK